ncbi:MAG: C-GCAxxG-C-C family protein [Eubacteriales bacterium]|nr:C-GCAxxG-C-C family protein [Eubacteriales bacterium]
MIRKGNEWKEHEMTIDQKGALAKAYFEEGYNCAQSVLLAYCEETGLEKKQAARLASTFGGGMGKLREVCGAVSAMFLVLGMTGGYDDPKAKEEKAALYDRVQKLAEAFKAEHHSIICRDLLIGMETSSGSAPEERTQAYYERRPCGCYVESAARILAREIGLPEA